MKRLFKHSISTLLILTFAFCLSSPALASSTPSFDDQTVLTEETDSGYIHVSVSPDKTATIITDSSSGLIDISVKYDSNPNKVYNWILSDFNPSAAPLSDTYWNEIIQYAETHVDAANIFYFEISESATLTELPLTRGATAGLALREELSTLIGSSEYIGESLLSKPYGGQQYVVKEDLEFNIAQIGTFTWRSVITVSALITTIVGALVTYPLVTVICTIWGIVSPAVSATIPPGTMNRYLTTATYTRYVSANGSIFPYNSTRKSINYYAYENADPNTSDSAKIDAGSRFEEYSDYRGATYFNSLATQVLDAHNVFLILGQKP